MARPMGDVKHLDCYGRDDDPDCQTSAAPLFDKAQATSELSTKASDDDLAAYFAQQQKQAERARKPITPKMQGAKKLADSKGTKFGLSAKAARQQANAIFGGAAHKQMKQQKTQLKLDTRAADKQVDAIFTDISKGTHGANNGALIDDNMAIQRKYGGEEKLITDDMKSVNTQQLRINHGKASKVYFFGNHVCIVHRPHVGWSCAGARTGSCGFFAFRTILRMWLDACTETLWAATSVLTGKGGGCSLCVMHLAMSN